MILLYEDFIKNKKGKDFKLERVERTHKAGFSQIYYFAVTHTKTGRINTNAALWLFKKVEVTYKNNKYLPIGLGKVQTRNLRGGLYTNILIHALNDLKGYGICSLSNTNTAHHYFSPDHNLRTDEADLFWSNFYKKQKQHGVKIDRVFNDTYKKYDYFLKK